MPVVSYGISCFYPMTTQAYRVQSQKYAPSDYQSNHNLRRLTILSVAMKNTLEPVLSGHPLGLRGWSLKAGGTIYRWSLVQI